LFTKSKLHISSINWETVQAILLSLSRDTIFLIPGVIILPIYFGIEGILCAAPIADVLSIIVTSIIVVIECKKIKKEELKIN
jgi:Na+-driven multidrug efflux pump